LDIPAPLNLGRGFFLYNYYQNGILDNMKKIEFLKFHGLGNDFLILDMIDSRLRHINYSSLARKICDRHMGVGADGILVLSRSKLADAKIDLFNSDGSWAEKSGNGLRIAASYFYTFRVRRKKLIFVTGSGTSEAAIIKSRERKSLVKVSLGQPEFRTKLIPMKSRQKFHINCPISIENMKLQSTALSVGNPHLVIFVKEFNFDWQTLGAEIEHNGHFPNRTNVEFAKIIGDSKLILNDWERGAGATGSSGTGAAAAVVAGVVNGLLKRKAEVVFPSGSLHIDWSENDNIIRLTGPVEFVSRGDYSW
jgi:diaminopimelate epimerase